MIGTAFTIVGFAPDSLEAGNGNRYEVKIPALAEDHPVVIVEDWNVTNGSGVDFYDADGECIESAVMADDVALDLDELREAMDAVSSAYWERMNRGGYFELHAAAVKVALAVTTGEEG